MAWYIKGTMGGGYGGLDNAEWELTDAESKEEAENWAIETACEAFEASGEFDYDAFKEENPDATEDDEWEAYAQERESWLSYGVLWATEDPNKC